MSLRTLGRHKPVIPVVTFQTPLAGIPPSQKDREASLSRSVSVPEIRIKSAFTLTFHAPFPSARSRPWDTCVNV